MARETPANQERLLKTLYRKYLIDGSLEDARKLREQILAGNADPAELALIQDVEFIILPRGWRAYNQGDFAAAKAFADRCLSISGNRSAYALTLLGFSLLRLGDGQQATDCMNEVMSIRPGFIPAKLFFSEFAMGEDRIDEAKSLVLEVLRSRPEDETTMQWSLNLLAQACGLQRTGEPYEDALADLADLLSYSPAFLVELARQHFRSGQKSEALRSIAKALELNPDHRLAAQLRAEWVDAQTEPGKNL